MGSVVVSLALAPVDTLATNLAIGAAPPERAGAASALTETAAEFGGALGIAVLGVIGTSIYRSQLTGALPSGILPASAAAARDTLGGALAVPGNSPSSRGRSWSRRPAAFTMACMRPLPSAPPPCSVPPSSPRSSSVTCARPLSPMALSLIALSPMPPNPIYSGPDGRESHVA